MVDKLVKETFAALDHEAFAISSVSIMNPDLLSKCIVVDETSDEHSRTTLACKKESATVAVVHRNANVSQAARSICGSCVRFRGRSSYSPDIILVNEWVKSEFIQSCLQAIIEETAALVMEGENGPYKEAQSLHTDRVSSNDRIVHYSSSQIQFVELKDR